VGCAGVVGAFLQIGVDGNFEIRLTAETGEPLSVHLKTSTRDGDSVLILFSNLPETVSAKELGETYRKRRWIETAFVAYHIMQCIIKSIETAGHCGNCFGLDFDDLTRSLFHSG
jgi:hypothetical protein